MRCLVERLGCGIVCKWTFALCLGRTTTYTEIPSDFAVKPVLSGVLMRRWMWWWWGGGVRERDYHGRSRMKGKEWRGRGKRKRKRKGRERDNGDKLE